MKWEYYFTNVISSKQRAALGNLTKPLQTLAIECSCRRGCQQAVECDGPPFNRTNSERALRIGHRTPTMVPSSSGDGSPFVLSYINPSEHHPDL